MLDPVSAIGVTAAALDFLQHGLDALDLCRQIRDDAEGATATNKALESSTEELKDIVETLRPAVSTPNHATRSISSLASQYIALADELLKLLKDVRGAGNPKTFATKKFFKVLREKRTIEKLSSAMKSKQENFDTANINYIRYVLFALFSY